MFRLVSAEDWVESGTITLGIALPVLEKMAINMSIEHLGGRLTL